MGDIENNKEDSFVSAYKKKQIKPKTKAIVSMIIGKEYVVFDIGGNGLRVAYSEKEHSSLKKGDSVEL